MAFTLDYVENLLERNSVVLAKKCRVSDMMKIKKTPTVTQTKLYESLTVTKTIKREIMVERDVTDVTEIAVALK